ncbi:MAG: DNA methyltransferase [Acidimicrobiia bacterium]
MDKNLRTAIGNAAQAVRRLLEEEYAEQLDGIFDIQRSGSIAEQPGSHLSPAQRVGRRKIVAAIGYHQAAGVKPSEAVARFIRDAAFTTLNRFVALKMLEARELIQPAITDGESSSGYREFTGLAPGVTTLGDAAGYRLYLESLFDELASEVKVLFDRHDAASLLWPRRNAFESMLASLNATELAPVWGDDETIGWFYQFFNSKEERQKMRDESQAPRNSRELAVRNQFFTPRYVVQFLVDNTLGRTWIEMTNGETSLIDRCEYFVTLEDERPQRPVIDPRDFRILDPACGSGHFLLYSFDLLDVMYREAWASGLGKEEVTGQSLRETYATSEELERAIPSLIVERNLHGVDIDPRAAQIAALAIWLRAQRAWRDAGISAADRPQIRKTGVVIAEPMPGDAELVAHFARTLQPPLLSRLFNEMVQAMSLAGEMGTLLRAETLLADAIERARREFVNQRIQAQALPGFDPEVEQGELDLSGIDDDAFFAEAEDRLLQALFTFVTSGGGSDSARRRLFADDAAQGVALLELLRTRFDVVLMNPPFGAGSTKAKKVFDASYPKTKNDVYAAFVERGIQLLVRRGMLGAITSRTGFFLSSFQKWREDVILDTAPPLVFADLGQGVLDGAMVEVAAYALERSR